MDIKKTKAADLESTRLTRFLLALVLVLSAVFVAFEYTTGGGAGDDDDMMDDLPNDLEMTPVTQQQDRVALMARQKPAAKAAQIKVVSNDVELPSADDPVKNSAGEHDDATGEGAANGADGQDADGHDDDDQKAALSPLATDMKDNPLNFHVVEDLPQFPGGAVEFMKWLTRNLQYPSEAQRQGVQGKVLVQFIVGRDGAVSGLKVVKSLHPACDREALRVLRMMPRWKPGIQHDKPCRTMVCIPIIFKI